MAKKKLTYKQEFNLKRARKIKEYRSERFKRVLEKEGPLSMMDLHDFYHGLPKYSRDLAGQFFLSACSLRGQTAKEVYEQLKPDKRRKSCTA